MTDHRTTELLREGLTEHGIEWRSGLEGVTIVGDWCFVEYSNGKLAATCEPVLTPEQAIAATLGSASHPYEQRITGDGSDWGEIMRDAYDDLMASAGESCTPEQMRQLADHIRAELVGGTCHGESDLSEWVCSKCQCWIPLGLTPENIKNASEWRYCPHCGAKVKAVKR